MNKKGTKLYFYHTAVGNKVHGCSLWFQFMIVSLWLREKPVSNACVIFMLLRDGALKAS